FGWTLVHFVWQGVAIALLLVGVLALLRRSSSNARYAAACAALAAMAVSPIVTLRFVAPLPAVPLQRTLALPAVEPVAVSGLAVQPVTIDHDLGAATIASFDSAADPVPAPTFQLPSPTVRDRMERVLPWFVVAWLVGVLGLSIRLLVGWVRVQ